MIGKALMYSLRLSLVIVFAGFFWLGGLVLFTMLIPSGVEDIKTKTDGIVVFTGGKTRLQVALSLFEEGKGTFLLVSGVNPDSDLSQLIQHIPHKSQITLGYEAFDTVGNAGETAKWAHQNHIKTIRLITSNYHMPRSLYELRHTLPEVSIVPHPVVAQSFLDPKWWLDPLTLTLVVQEYNKFLFSFIRRLFSH